MDRLPTLPIFYKLDGKRVIIAGGGEPAVWKAELLAAAGARVEVLAAEPCDDLEDLVRASAAATIRIVRRDWLPADLIGAALALGAIDDDVEADRFRLAAAQAGVPVNVIDKPAFCDFQFGTIIARSPLVISITTDGAAPVFGQAIRTRIESLLPSGLEDWAQAAKDWRPAVQERGWDFRRRRRFWETLTDLALAASGRSPTLFDQRACFDAAEGGSSAPSGSVTLVGGGSGQPDCLTFAAARALQGADLVVYDKDVAELTINLARREAAKLLALEDEATVALMADKAEQGRRAVWLGTGNPLSCRRWRRRIELLVRAGCVPGHIAGLSSCPHCEGSCPDANNS